MLTFALLTPSSLSSVTRTVMGQVAQCIPSTIRTTCCVLPFTCWVLSARASWVAQHSRPTRAPTTATLAVMTAPKMVLAARFMRGSSSRSRRAAGELRDILFERLTSELDAFGVRQVRMEHGRDLIDTYAELDRHRRRLSHLAGLRRQDVGA